MVFPGLVYISHPTEYGTIYGKAELEVIAETAHRHGMPLFVDGARLGYGLTAAGTDVTLPDLARIADVFYIGGTKVGALFGEAVVFTKGNTPKHFLTQIKQHGALLAKGWLLGLQFGTLFTDDLYLRIAANANRQADRIREALRERGYTDLRGADEPGLRHLGPSDHRTAAGPCTHGLHGEGRQRAYGDAPVHQLGDDRRAG